MNFQIYAITALLVVLAACDSHSQMQCNTRSTQKRQVIQNPAQLPRTACRYTIEAWSRHVCQVRLDFERFEMSQPELNESTQTYECLDYIKVGEFKLCGRQTEQHLYLPFQSRLELDIQLSKRWPQTMWQLIVTQLECAQSNARRTNDIGLPFFGLRTIFANRPTILDAIVRPNAVDFELLAPLGCHQYYQSATGTIRSLNHGGVYMPNTNYAICIKDASMQQEIEYSFINFAMSGHEYSGSGYDYDCHPPVHTAGRAEDYLLIPKSNLINNAALQPTFYCGNKLHGVTITAQAPFVIYFASDASSDASETGFELTYKA